MAKKRVQPISEMTLNVSQIWINLMKKIIYSIKPTKFYIQGK